MTDNVATALDKFIDDYVQKAVEYPELLQIAYDPEWPSPCYACDIKSEGSVSWQPVKRLKKESFKDLENALGITIHQDLVSFYGRYWSDNLNAKTSKGSLQLLQPWNEDDFIRLQQNLVGHVLMKKRLKQPETLFFALTDEEDFILTLDNQTGEVVLEQIGLRPQEVVAPDLASFLQSLQPDLVNLVL